MIPDHPPHLSLRRFLPSPALAACLAGCLLAAPASQAQSTRRTQEGGAANFSQVAGSSWETSPPRLTLGDNTSLRLLAQMSLRLDDNIFTAADNEVSDTIISVTPGLEFRFGNNSRLRGNLKYEEAFVRYTGETAPNATLGSGEAALAFESGRLALAGGITLQERYQNSQQVAGLGQDIVARSKVSNIYVSAETPLTAKTSFSVAVQRYRTQYETAGLIGTRDLTLPVKLYFDLTPKLSLSTGYTYRQVQPQGGGDESRDQDFNLGARGNFTSKLSGQFSLGYRTRQVGLLPTENLWGFDGTFFYEMTPLVSSSFSLSRDFGTGTQGASLKTNSFSFGLAAALSPRWRISTGLSYRYVDYGAVVFSPTLPQPPDGRTDNYWEGNLQATFFPGRSFNTSLGYTVSSNHSTRRDARYGSNVLNLLLGWQY